MQEKLSLDKFLTIKKVYYVESSTDETVLVAIHAEYDTETHSLTWWDTLKERRKQVKSMEITDTTLEVIDQSGTHYTFKPMTLSLYNARVKSQLIEGREFDTEEALKRAFEETII